jgi:transposase-like protein
MTPRPTCWPIWASPPLRPKLHSTHPLERLIGEVKRRTGVVGIFPNEDAVQRARYMTLETIAPLSDNSIASLPALAD